MNFLLKEQKCREIYRILSSNIEKVNYLNISLLGSNYNYLKIKQFLNEFEFDLKLIYDILKQSQNSSNHQSNFGQFKSDKRKQKYLNLSDRIKKHLNLNSLDECEKNDFMENKKGNKKYNLTINILSDKYFNSKRKKNKKFNKSCSCKSYKKNFSKNIIKNLKKMQIRGNSALERIKDKNINDNKIMAFLTDYSTKKDFYESNNNKFRTNIDKNKVSLKHLNTLYNYYDELLRKNTNNDKSNNNTNYENSTIPTNKFDFDDNNFNDTSYYYNYNNPLYKTYNIINSEENINQNEINITDNIMFNEDNGIIDKNISNDNYKNHYYDYIKDYEKNNNYMKEEIIKKIISEILNDNNKLNELKKNFGKDIGQRLLDRGLDDKEINIIYDFVKKSENRGEKNLFRGSKNSYRNYKYDNNKNKKDILLLRNSMREKCHECNTNIYNNDYNDYLYDQMPLTNEY